MDEYVQTSVAEVSERQTKSRSESSEVASLHLEDGQEVGGQEDEEEHADVTAPDSNVPDVLRHFCENDDPFHPSDILLVFLAKVSGGDLDDDPNHEDGEPEELMEQSCGQHGALVGHHFLSLAWGNRDNFKNKPGNEVNAGNCEHPDGRDFSGRGLHSAISVSVELELIEPVQSDETLDVLSSSELWVNPVIELYVERLAIVILDQIDEVG